MKICKNNKCTKRAISYSNYCGEHLSQNEWCKTFENSFKNEKIVDSLYLSELNISKKISIKNKKFSFIEINDCIFENLSLVNCVFENCQFIDTRFISSNIQACSFIDCDFNQLYFSKSIFQNSKFEKVEFNNSTLCDLSIDYSTYSLCNISNTNFWDIISANKAVFDQCIFTISSLNGSCLDFTTFQGVEFSRSTIAFCSFINSKFINISSDFKESVGPIACNFYSATIDHDFKQTISSEKSLNNFYIKSKKEYLINVIRIIVEQKDTYHLQTLRNLLIEQAGNLDLYDLKQSINDYYTFIFQKARNENDIELCGTIISEYTKLPDEIKTENLRISSENNRVNNSRPYAIIEFSPTIIINFSAISELNNKLSKICFELIGEDKIEIESINKGSLIETISGDISDILILISCLYAATKASVSIIKQGVEIKKLLAETKHIEMQTKILSQEIEKKNVNEKSINFARTIKELQIDIDVDYDDLKSNLYSISHNTKCLYLVQDIDEKYIIKNIDIHVNT